MAQKKRIHHVEAYYVKTKGVEIGPFRSREAALAEAKAIKASGDPNVKIARKQVTPDEFDFAKKAGGDGGKKKVDPDDDFFEDEEDDDEEEDDDLDDLFDDEDEDDEDENDDEDEDEDEPPAVTHPFFRPLGKGKK